MFAASADLECLERLQLAKPVSLAERFYAALVWGALTRISASATSE
jgi:hypothetical protein